MSKNITIGIYGLASQSGMAYFADFLSRNYRVIGYNRVSEHGTKVIEAIRNAGGVTLERPQNSNNEKTQFYPLGDSKVTSDISELIENSTLIIIALPSIYHIEAATEMCKFGLWRKRIPLILSPSRTFATPYLWKILGDGYPIVCFSTCPYSCKHPTDTVALIKRRKRTWMASLEGEFTSERRELIETVFPQAAITHIPALTSLNNIGAVFHCATYIMNRDEIDKRKSTGEIFSFYIDGIARRPEVGEVLEKIDQVRLQIADKLGISSFGLDGNSRDELWRKLTNGLRALEEEYTGEVDELRAIRKLFMQFINGCVLSAHHWLDITYGVIRIPGESMCESIARTPTYQSNSVPQLRYVEEDIPTGLVPLEAIAQRLNIDAGTITNVIESYNKLIGFDIRSKGRNLKEFSTDEIVSYLKGGKN